MCIVDTRLIFPTRISSMAGMIEFHIIEFWYLFNLADFISLPYSNFFCFLFFFLFPFSCGPLGQDGDD